MNIENHVGETIKNLRTEKHWSQEALAEAAGLNRSYIGGLERGENIPGIVNLAKVAAALEVSPGFLLDDGFEVTVVKIHWQTFQDSLGKNDPKGIFNFLTNAGVKFI